MRKLFMIVCTAAVSFSLYGCSFSEVEKVPVVVEDSTGDEVTQTSGFEVNSSDNTASDDKDSNDANTSGNISSDQSHDELISDTDAYGNTKVVNGYEALNEAEEVFTTSIELEGMTEQINSKIYHSSMGYQMSYDIDRFTVTASEGMDNFMAENPDPQVYPYIYLNIQRLEEEINLKTAVKNTDTLLKYLKSASQSEIDTNDEDLKIKQAGSIMIGAYDAYHFKTQVGSDWNSAIRDFYLIETENGDIYLFETQYFLEAAEGYGARVLAMLKTFQFE